MSLMILTLLLTLPNFDFSDFSKLDSESYLRSRARLLRDLNKNTLLDNKSDTRLLPQDSSFQEPAPIFEPLFKYYEPPNLSREALMTNEIMKTTVDSIKVVTRALQYNVEENKELGESWKNVSES